MPDGDSDIEISPATGSKQPPSEPQSGCPCVFWVRGFLPTGTRSGLVGKVSSSCWECCGPEEFPSQREWDSGLRTSPELAAQRGQGWGGESSLAYAWLHSWWHVPSSGPAGRSSACGLLCWSPGARRMMKKTQHCGPSPRSGTSPATREVAACAGHQASTCCAKPPTGSWASLSPCHPCT